MPVQRSMEMTRMRRRVHVSLTEARLFCSHYGWRLPHTWCDSTLFPVGPTPSMTVVLGRQGVELRRAGHGRSRVSVGRRARLQGWRHGVPGEECDRWLALPAAAATHTRGPGGLGQRHGIPAGCFTVRCDGPRRQCEWIRHATSQVPGSVPSSVNLVRRCGNSLTSSRMSTRVRR